MTVFPMHLEAPNPTPDGIYQPADGLPKPSVCPFAVKTNMKEHRRLIATAFAWVILTALLTPMALSCPPRHLDASHVLRLFAFPIAAYLLAHRSIPARWFGYLATLSVAWILDGFAFYVRGTAQQFGLAPETGGFLVATLIIAIFALLSTMTAWIHRRTLVSRSQEHNAANKASDATSEPATGAASPSHQG